MDFKLVSKAAAVKTFREGTYDDELIAAVEEIWAIVQEHGEGYVIETPAFPSQEEADKWMAKAQAYGKTRGWFVHKARGYVPSVENALVISAEDAEERQERIRERKEKAADLEKRKAAGEIVQRGRKKAAA